MDSSHDRIRGLEVESGSTDGEEIVDAGTGSQAEDDYDDSSEDGEVADYTKCSEQCGYCGKCLI